MTDYISSLWAVTAARAEEARQPKPNEFVLATCDWFKAMAWEEANQCVQNVVMSEPRETDDE